MHQFVTHQNNNNNYNIKCVCVCMRTHVEKETITNLFMHDDDSMITDA